MKVTIDLPADMAAWLQSVELGNVIAGHIGGNEMPAIEDRIIHLLDVSEYQVDLNTKPQKGTDEIPF